MTELEKDLLFALQDTWPYVHQWCTIDSVKNKVSRLLREHNVQPVDMVLFCPSCGLQHVDEAEPRRMHDQIACSLMNGRGNKCTCDHWGNPPHRSHLCRKEDGGCGFIWRPADVPTNGVRKVRTEGRNDSPVTEDRGPLKFKMLREQANALHTIGSTLKLPAGTDLVLAVPQAVRTLWRRGM